jgi:acyl-CoA carboxylase subunit beta
LAYHGRSYLSVISPEGGAAILWRDPSRAVEAADALKVVPQHHVVAGVANELVPSPGYALPTHRLRAAILAGADQVPAEAHKHTRQIRPGPR